MSNEHYPYLCGGILLNLLIEAKKTPVNSREKLNCKKSSVSDSNILKGLIKLVTGEEVIASPATLKKDTSRYKRCEINNSSIITFTDSSTVKIFRDRVKNSCWEILDETTSFITTFLSEAKLEWFSKAILEIITNDTSIPDNTYFKTTHMKKIEKKEFKQANNLEMAIVKMLLRKPEYYNFFKEEKLESDIANKIFKFFNQKIKENLFLDSSIIMREIKNYIKESNNFSQYEKDNELARIIMDYVLIPNKIEEERENTELFKSYLREKLKLRDKTKDNIAKKIEFGKLKKEIAKTKSVEEFIKVYNSFKYLF